MNSKGLEITVNSTDIFQSVIDRFNKDNQSKEKYNVAGTKLYGYKTDIYNYLGLGPDNIGVTTTDNGEVQVTTTE